MAIGSSYHLCECHQDDGYISDSVPGELVQLSSWGECLETRRREEIFRVTTLGVQRITVDHGEVQGSDGEEWGEAEGVHILQLLPGYMIHAER